MREEWLVDIHMCVSRIDVDSTFARQTILHVIFISFSGSVFPRSIVSHVSVSMTFVAKCPTDQECVLLVVVDFASNSHSL